MLLHARLKLVPALLLASASAIGAETRTPISKARVRLDISYTPPGDTWWFGSLETTGRLR